MSIEQIGFHTGCVYIARKSHNGNDPKISRKCLLLQKRKADFMKIEVKSIQTQAYRIKN